MSTKNAVPVAVGISLAQLNIETVMVPIVGDSPIICHRWSEKAIREMLDKQTKKPSAGRPAKDPVKDYLDSLYRMPDGRYGFPSVAFKNAAVTACTSLSGVTKVAARQAFRVIGEMAPVKTVFNGSEMRINLVAIEGSEPEMREDMVRIGMGVADIRYRGQFFPWKCLLAVSFNANVLSRDQIVNLFNTAGFAVGVGEWRQEKNGEYGAFHVDTKAFDGLIHAGVGEWRPENAGDHASFHVDTTRTDVDVISHAESSEALNPDGPKDNKKSKRK